MNIEKIKQFVELANELKEEGVYGFHFEKNEFHVSVDAIKQFENLEIKERSNSNFPFELSYVKDDFKIYSLAKRENLKGMTQFREFLKADLLKQLAELENEGEVIA